MNMDDRKVGIACLTILGAVSALAIIAMSFYAVPGEIMDKAIPSLSAIATTAVGAIASAIRGVKTQTNSETKPN